MKLDPGIHIVMHLVLSLKPGVTLSRACSIVFSYHLLSTNHKCTHPCITAVQSKIIVRSFLKILRSSRRISPSQLAMKLKSAASYTFIYSLKNKDFRSCNKYFNTLFHYGTIMVFHFIFLPYVWNLILAYI